MVIAPSRDSIKIDAERCRRSFALFVKEAWHVIEPGTPLLWNWHLDALCLHLSALARGDIKRLLINIAPGHAKSSIISDLFPDWCWINDPYLRFLCASHSSDLAIRDNKNRRDLIESEWFQERYGHVFKLSSSQNVKSYFENDQRGYMMATAVRSSGTGKRADISLIDDANNAMAGEADILAVKEWFGKTWIPRLNDQENGPMIVVGQRLDERDLSGHILKLGGWTHLNLPEEFESKRKCRTFLSNAEQSTEPITVEINSYTTPGKIYKVVFANGKATNCTCEDHFFHPSDMCKHMQNTKAPENALKPFWEDPRTVEGELLWEEKFPRAVLDKFKFDIGSMNYAAQYQQSPVPSEGGKFKEKWFRYYTPFYRVDMPGTGNTIMNNYQLHTPQGDRHVLIDQCWRFGTVDLAISSKQTADYTVFAIWDVTPERDLILRKIVRARLSNAEQVNMLDQLTRSEHVLYWKIESVAYQQAFVQQGIALGIPCREYNPRKAGDKVIRSAPFAVWMENGKAYFPDNADWMYEVKDELLKFPRGSHDDIVDVCSMAADEVVSPALPLQGDEPSYTSEQEQAPTTYTSIVPVPTLAEIAKIDPFAWADAHLGGGW